MARAYFPIGELDRAALDQVKDAGWAMKVPLLALTASGVILALCSNTVIGFLQMVGQGAL